MKPTLKLFAFPVVHRLEGGYVLDVILGEDHHTQRGLVKGTRIRSSRLLKADFDLGQFETLNTVYVVAS
jgi:hypothetical protein